jgi:hypothetical protein
VYGSLGYGVVSVLGAALMVPAVTLSAWWTFRRPALRPTEFAA